MTTNITLTCTGRAWILKKMANEIIKNCPKDLTITFGSVDPEKNKCINYYMPYTRFRVDTKGIDIPFFTHPENRSFIARALRADHCVVMCEKYKKELISKGVKEKNITVIYPGVDHNVYKPTLKILQTVKMQSEKRRGRKGFDIWERVCKLPYAECLCTEGEYTDEQILELYKSTDIVLSTSRVEGGPMCVLEGLSLGKTVVAPEGVGFINDFSGMKKYRMGNFKSLKKVLDNLYLEKVKISKNVEKYTWEKWANDHYNLFRRLGDGIRS